MHRRGMLRPILRATGTIRRACHSCFRAKRRSLALRLWARIAVCILPMMGIPAMPSLCCAMFAARALARLPHTPCSKASPAYGKFHHTPRIRRAAPSGAQRSIASPTGATTKSGSKQQRGAAMFNPSLHNSQDAERGLGRLRLILIG